MVTITRIRTLGGSLAVTIPIELVRSQGLKEDEIVEIEVKKHKKDYFGALKGIGKFTDKDRMEDRE
jgi:antitoxin component of MazEF toxin-antitoxin module